MPDETAMLLTQEEWEDLALMVAHYRSITSWFEDSADAKAYAEADPEHAAMVMRRRRLAKRIMDAAEA